MNRRIGLTGGIGSGKSTVAGWLAERGALIIDTDAIARALTLSGGAALEAIRQRFGPEAIAPDGSMDRAWMRELAFADPAARRDLESILHPLIGRETGRQATLAAPGQCLVFDVPLLAESAHWRDGVDRVLVIDCSEDTQVARVVRRSGWSPEQVRQVIAQQATRPARRAIADAVIVNDGNDRQALSDELDALWHSGFFAAGVAQAV